MDPATEALRRERDRQNFLARRAVQGFFIYLAPEEQTALLRACRQSEQSVLRNFARRLEKRRQGHHTEKENDYAWRAHAYHHRDGELEIDPNALVSWDDDGGAYVMAWFWIDD